MQNNNNKGVITALLIALSITILVLSWNFSFGGKKAEPATGLINVGVNRTACVIATSTRMLVGKDIPVFLASTSTNRSSLNIQADFGATSTIALQFNGAVATTGTNFMINGPKYSQLVNTPSANATTSTSWNAGKDTDFPYTGAVSAIAIQGTTTVLVSECVYDPSRSLTQ